MKYLLESLILVVIAMATAFVQYRAHIAADTDFNSNSVFFLVVVGTALILGFLVSLGTMPARRITGRLDLKTLVADWAMLHLMSFGIITWLFTVFPEDATRNVLVLGTIAFLALIECRRKYRKRLAKARQNTKTEGLKSC